MPADLYCGNGPHVFGDLFCLSQTIAVCLPTGWSFCAKTFIDGVVGIRLGLAATDLFADALTHYADAAAHLRTLGVELVIGVRPSAAGFQAAFPLSEGDRMAAAQWEEVWLSRCDDKWWIHDVTFAYYRSHGGARFRDILRTIGRADCAPTGRMPGLHATRDLTFLVDVYRNWLQSPTDAYLVLTRDTSKPAPAMMAILREVDWRLVYEHWHVTALLLDVDPANADKFVLRIGGPPDTFDAARIATRLRSLGGARFEALVERSSRGARSVAPRPRYRDWKWLERRVSHATSSRLGNQWWAAPPYRWPALQRFLLGVTLALAPCHLTPYVVLWIVEWLPEMRHHVHIQALRAIEAVQKSIARVLQRRALAE